MFGRAAKQLFAGGIDVPHVFRGIHDDDGVVQGLEYHGGEAGKMVKLDIVRCGAGNGRRFHGFPLVLQCLEIRTRFSVSQRVIAG
jgi:hypothetical protein